MPLEIAKNTNIYILRGVPIDKDYNHTLYFSNATQQLNTFLSAQNNFVKYQQVRYSYQREHKNMIRVEILNDLLYDCNYLIFQNSQFGNKWFYCFIDRTEYINNSTTDIYYTVDYMQTWYFDYDLGECFVEREHTETDNFGEHIINEDFNIGNYVNQQVNQYETQNNGYTCLIYYIPNFTKSALIIDSVKYVSVDDANSDPSIFNYNFTIGSATAFFEIFRISQFSNLPRAFKILSFPVALLSDYPNSSYTLNSALSIGRALIALEDAGATIISIKIIPTYVNSKLGYNTENSADVFNFLQPVAFRSASGTATYVPKNKKLYSYPYSKIIVTNNAGQTAEYKFEKFLLPISQTIASPSFLIKFNNSIDLNMELIPYNYDRIELNTKEKLLYNEFIDMPWNVDSFRTWLAQNLDSKLTGLTASAVASVAGMIAMSALSPATGTAYTAMMASMQSGAWTSLVSEVGSAVTEGVHAINTPDQIRGQTNTDETNYNDKKIGFTFYSMGCTADVAESIDNYFTMFGYKINKLKIPNIRNANATLRPHWNYIKTKSCLIHSASGTGLPQDAENTIQSIYNKGITFWNNYAEIGNYSLNNAPAST